MLRSDVFWLFVEVFVLAVGVTLSEGFLIFFCVGCWFDVGVYVRNSMLVMTVLTAPVEDGDLSV